MNKYKNKKIVANGIKFDSKAEYEYYKYLCDFYYGKNVDIKLQEVFELQPKFSKFDKNYRAINYKADFSIYDESGKLIIVIDVKGMVLPLAKLKKKLFEYKYDVPLRFVAKCPKKYESYGADGWIDVEKLEKLRRDAKKSK